MDWSKKKIDSDSVRSLSSRFGIDLLTASVLVRRGLTGPMDLLFYLEDELRYTHNPYTFMEMEEAVERIHQAAEEGERVKIVGDRDTDGITSAVIMIEALAALGIDAEWTLPKGDEPYGLTGETVDKFAAAQGTLFITVDCGISNHAEIARARELGIDTIVVDHHNPQEQLPPAYAIINPKVPDCGYPFQGLAGCGVTAKLAWALFFSKTPFYNQPVCLLNVRPGNEAYILEAVIINNLVEVDRISETLVPGVLGIEQTRLSSFLTGKAILVYEASSQKRMLQTLFGVDTEIHLTDIAPIIWKAYPDYAEKSLLRLKNPELLGRYEDRSLSELDVLGLLFTAYVYTKEPALTDSFVSILDLVALGTLADLMPLQDENRILVRIGLSALNKTKRTGLQGILAKQNLYGRSISTTDIGWQVSPLINATGRLGVPEKALNLLLTRERLETQEMVDEIFRLNQQRKKLGDEAWELILPQARESFERLGGKLVQVGSSEIHRGVTGILATRLVKFFNAPALVVALLEEKAIGSARSVTGFNVKEFLDKLADIFIDHGGHDYAAGYSMGLSRYGEFQKRLEELSEKIAAFSPPDKVLDVDAELPLEYMSPEVLGLVERFEPYGEGNAPLLLLMRGVKIIGLDFIGRNGQPHVRLLLDSGRYKWPSVYWNAADKVGKEFSVDDRVDVVFRLGRNYFQGQEKLQLTILDMRK